MSLTRGRADEGIEGGAVDPIRTGKRDGLEAPAFDVPINRHLSDLEEGGNVFDFEQIVFRIHRSALFITHSKPFVKHYLVYGSI